VALPEAAGAVAHATGTGDLVDASVFAGAREVCADLRRRSCSSALQWAAEHRARLRRHQSSLEFKLRMQDFIEFVREGRRGDAVAYAREHFPPHAKAHLALVQRAMATAAFETPAAAAAAYPTLFAEEAWVALEDLFVREHRALHCAPGKAPLMLALSAGLSALRTQACDEGEDAAIRPGDHAQLLVSSGSKPGPVRARRCPACLPLLQPLCAGLPHAHHTHSELICDLTGERMDENNPPYILPNGRLISAAVLNASSGLASGADAGDSGGPSDSGALAPGWLGVASSVASSGGSGGHSRRPGINAHAHIYHNSRQASRQATGGHQPLGSSQDRHLVTDPRTGEVFPRADVRKAFVM